MEYFWKQQDDIPLGNGYPLFGKEHIASTAVTMVMVVLFAYFFKRIDERKQSRVLKSIPLFMAALEILKDLFLVRAHRFGLGYLPLHVCSIGIFVFLLREFLPWKKAKDISGEVAVILIMPGALAALIFPDWTYLYPVLNFINLHSYLWHGLLILYPLMLLIKREVKPGIKHIHYVLLFLCLVVPPIYVFDKMTGCNYFFVSRPEVSTPLEWIYNITGSKWYLIGYGILTVAVILAEYVILYVVRNIRSRSENNHEKNNTN